MLSDHVSVSVMCKPRNLKLSTISTDGPLMEMGVWLPLDFLKSTMISLVLLVLSERLLLSHHRVGSSISLL